MLPGDSFDLGVAADQLAFSRLITDNIATALAGPTSSCTGSMWWIAPCANTDRASVLFDSIDNTSFFVAGTRIGIRNPEPDEDPRNVCIVNTADFTVGALDLQTAADVVGVFHDLTCRDRANGTNFTANGASVSWHEIHHALFGLADEYVGDGGYWQAQQNPNVFSSLQNCQKLTSGDPALCHEMAASPPNRSNGFWRADTASGDTVDVMVNNTVQRSNDVRAARAKYAKCRAKQC
jgi:hypothetical protein